MRDKLNEDKQEAMRILDGVRVGVSYPLSVINWALWTLGDLNGQPA